MGLGSPHRYAAPRQGGLAMEPAESGRMLCRSSRAVEYVSCEVRHDRCCAGQEQLRLDDGSRTTRHSVAACHLQAACPTGIRPNQALLLVANWASVLLALPFFGSAQGHERPFRDEKVNLAVDSYE